MPISDEIIELEPVKKSKSKLIIMFVALGVLLGLAVTFLVLYLIKPNVEVDNVKASKVEQVPVDQSTIVSGTSPLFQMTGEDGETINYASVLNKYTVSVLVTADDEDSAKISWFVEPRGAAIILEEGPIEGKPNQFYMTFMPNPEGVAYDQITLTARSQTNSEAFAAISFKAVNQGTEYILLKDYWRGTSGTYQKVTSDELVLPYYEGKDNTYYVTYEQLGMLNPITGEYANRTVQTNSDDEKIDIESSNRSILTASVRDSNPPRFEFKLLGVGEADITLTANAHNDYHDPVKKTLHIKVENSKDRGNIDDIRFVAEPIDEAFFKTYYGKPTSALPFVDSLTLPYGVTYDNILSHVLLSPMTLQYDPEAKEGSRLLTDWYSMLEFTTESDGKFVTRNDYITISTTNNIPAITTRTSLATGADCVLRAADISKDNIGIKRDVKLNIVAQCRESGVTLDQTSVTTSPGVTSAVNVKFAVTAPSGTDADTLNKYISANYILEYSKDVMSVKIGGKDVDPYSSTNKTVNDLSANLSFKQDDKDKTLFNAQALMVITMKSAVANGTYDLNFTRVGSNLSKIDIYNPTVSRKVSFDVTAIVKKVSFADNAVEILMAGGLPAADFNRLTYSQNEKGEWVGEANVYAQILAKGNTLSIDYKSLISKDVDGGCTFEQSWTQEPNTDVFTVSGDKLVFTGALPSNNNPLATAVVTVKNNEKTTVGRLTFNLYLMDALTGMQCKGDDNTKLNYGRTEFKKISMGAFSYIFRSGEVDPTNKYLYNIPFAQPNEFNLYYGDKSNRVMMYGRWNEDKTVKSFYLSEEKSTDDDLLFKYKNGEFEQQKDLFAYGYINDVNLSEITIEYFPNSKSFYLLNTVSATKTYTFVRHADDIVLSSDKNYTEIIVPDAGNYSYRINHYSYGELYCSPVVKFSYAGNDYSLIVRDTNDVSINGHVICETEAVYMDIPVYVPAEGEQDEVYGIVDPDGAYHKDKSFYNVSFTAPSAPPAEEKEIKCKITREYHTDNPYDLSIIVENYTRPIADGGIEIFANYDGSTCSGAVGAQTFGIFNNPDGSEEIDKIIEKSFYLRATYGDVATSNYTKFDSVRITVPQGFILTINGTAQELNEQNTYYVTPDTNDVKKTPYSSVWACKITLASNASDGAGKFEAINNASVGTSQTPISAGFDINVKTGLFKVTHSVEEGVSPDYIEFNLKNASDNPIACVNLNYIALTADNYTNIKYNFSDMALTLPVGFNGISCETTHATDSAPYLLFKVDYNTLTAGFINKTYTLTFKDAANCNPGRTITLNINITVTIGIYALDIDAIKDGDKTITTTGGTGNKEIPVQIRYNNGGVQPTDKNSVVAEIVALKDNNYVDCDFSGVALSARNDENNTFTLTISNERKNGFDDDGNQLYLRIKYNENDYKYAKIEIVTDSNDIRLVQNSLVEVNEGNGELKANVLVRSPDDTFAVKAEVYNIGTSEKVSGTIYYALYPTKTDRTNGTKAIAATKISIDSNGNINFINPPSNSATIYYRASYTDIMSGTLRYIDVNIIYNVAFDSISLNNKFVIDGANTIVLHYINSDNYTYVPDLSQYINVKLANGYTTASPHSYTITLSTAENAKISVANTINAYKVAPANISGSDPATIEETLTITVNDGYRTASVTAIVKIIRLSNEVFITDNDGAALVTAEMTSAGGAVKSVVNDGGAFKADIVVKEHTDTFSIVAKIYNLGVKDPVSGTVTYALYASADDRANDTNAIAATKISIDSNGIIQFVAPGAVSGTIYYRATFASASRSVDVDIAYTVAINHITLDDRLIKEGNVKTVILYYINDNIYTYVKNLAPFVKVHADDDLSLSALSCTLNMEVADDAKIKIIKDGTGFSIIPKAVSDGEILTIYATDSCHTISTTVKVIVKNIALNLSTVDGGNNTSSTVNILSDDAAYNSVTLKTTIASVSGLNSHYTVTRNDADDRVMLGTSEATPATTRKSVADKDVIVKFDRDNFNAADYKTYTINIRGTYEIDSYFSDIYAVKSGIENIIHLDTTYALTASADYTPDFKVTLDGVTIPGGSEREIASGTYKIELIGRGAAYTYSVGLSNDIIKLAAGKTEFDSNDYIEFSFATGKAGTVTITVTATVYSKEFTKSLSYTFTDGSNVSDKLEKSSDNGSTYAAFADASLAADFDGSSQQAYKFRYTVDASTLGVSVPVGNVTITVSSTLGGAIEKSDMVKSGELFYVDVTVLKQTTLTFNGEVRINGKTYHTAGKTVTVTATAPDFTLGSDDTVLSSTKNDPGGTYEQATLSVSQGDAAFKGGYTAVYSIASGNAYAEISTNKVVPKTNMVITTDQIITVCATITVTSGVFKDNVYYKYIDITIKSIPLPEIRWAASSEYVDVAETSGTAITLKDKVSLGLVNEAYKYSDSNITIVYTIKEQGGLTAADVSLADGTLTINDTNNTKAGGKITVNGVATITAGINVGKTVDLGATTFIITPKVHPAATAVRVKGEKGTYDVSGAVALYAATGDGFVQDGDNYSVNYALKNNGDSTNYGTYGSSLVIKNSILTSTSVVLVATVTYSNTSYNGVSVKCDVTINVYGVTLNESNVSWNTTTNAYNTVDVATLFTISEANPESGKSISDVRVTALTNGGFMSVAYSDSTHPVISVSKDFNVVEEGTTPKVIKYSVHVTVVGDNAYSNVYYGEGVINVDAIEFGVIVKYDDDSKSSGGTFSVIGGNSFVIKVSESHGLSVNSQLGDLGAFMSAVEGGNNYIVTTAPVSSETNQPVIVTVEADGIIREHKITVTIRPKPAVAPFTATNTTQYLRYNNSDSTGKAISVWTPSSDYTGINLTEINFYSTYTRAYDYATGRYIYLYLYNKIKSITVKAYDSVGTLKGTVNSVSSSLNSSSYSYKMSLSGLNSYSCSRLVIEIDYAIKYLVSYDVSVTLKWEKGGVADSYPIDYSVICSNANVTVRYDGNGGNKTTSVAYDYDAAVVAPTGTNIPTRAGYTLKGWYIVPDPTITKTTDSEYKYTFGTATNASNTLYAGWVKEPRTVTFDANGGTTPNPTSKEVTYGAAYDDLATTSRTGYSFVGWYTAKNGGSLVTANTVVSTDENHIVYAHWTANTYTVTFNANGGESPSVENKSVTYGAAYGDLATTTRTGYGFDGWFTAASGGTQVQASTTVAITGVQTLYAHWTANTYTVTLAANGGTIDSADTKDVSVTYGGTYSTIVDPDSRTGYTFVGWYTAASGGTQVLASTTVAIIANQTLYAHWTANTYILTFDANGGTTPSPANKQVTYADVYGTLATTSRAGYTFAGWFTAKDGVSEVLATDTVAITGAQTLYAHWTAKPYTVTFNANGGTTPSPASKQVTYDATYGTLATTSLAGYTFAGWFTAASGGIEVTKDTTVAITGAQTLYAHWTANTYTVTFNANDGESPSVENKSVTYGATYGELATTTRTGYTFAGWFTEASGGTQVSVSTTVAITGAQTLYAHWTANTYTVTLDANGGKISDGYTKNITVTFGAAYSTIVDPDSRAGYTFAGWYTAASDGTQVLASTVVAITDAQTLYAHWTANTITVTLDANGGTLGTTTLLNIVYSDSAKYAGLPATTDAEAVKPSRMGYTFAGWKYNDDVVTATTVLKEAVNHTLVAYWTANTYTVTFNANDGESPSVENKSVTYGAAYGMLATTTREGYRFAGWYTAASGGTKVMPTDTVAITSAQILYAHWTAELYTVTFNANGGTDPSPASKQVTYASTYGTLATTTRTGYGFDGWYTAASGGTEVTEDTVVAITGDQTLYAHWTANTYTVTFNANGGITPSPASKDVTYGAAYGELATTSLAAYTFAGWFTALSDGTQVLASTVVAITADQTLYAHWTANTITVTLDANGGTLGTTTLLNIVYSDSAKYAGLPATTDAQAVKPSRMGYTFAGWKYDDAVVTATTVLKVAVNHTLVAYWTANTYTVTFDANGGTIDSAYTKDVSVTYGGTYSTIVDPDSRTGYTFAGWFTAASGGTQVLASTTVAITGAQTLYAHWTINQYTVTFDYGYKAVNTDENNIKVQFSVEHGQPASMLTYMQISRTGYAFIGWYNNDSEVTTPPTITANTTFTAKWIEVGATAVAVKFSDGYVVFDFTLPSGGEWGTTDNARIYAWSETITYLGDWDNRLAMNGNVRIFDCSTASASSIQKIIITFNETKAGGVGEKESVNYDVTGANALAAGYKYSFTLTGWATKDDGYGGSKSAFTMDCTKTSLNI